MTTEGSPRDGGDAEEVARDDAADAENAADVGEKPRRVGTNWRRWLWLSGALAVADLAIKDAVRASDWGRASMELTSFLRLVHSQNTGAAFGIFADGGSAARWGLSALAAAVCAILLRFLATTKLRMERLACAMILGGALGNLIERIGRGSVTDYVDFHVGGWHWPAFNLADAAISGGVALLLGVWLAAKSP